MSDLVRTQIVCFLTHRLIFYLFVSLEVHKCIHFIVKSLCSQVSRCICPCSVCFYGSSLNWGYTACLVLSLIYLSSKKLSLYSSCFSSQDDVMALQLSIFKCRRHQQLYITRLWLDHSTQMTKTTTTEAKLTNSCSKYF